MGKVFYCRGIYAQTVMGSLTTRVSEGAQEKIEEMVDRGVYESKSEAVRRLVKYALYNKYGYEE